MKIKKHYILPICLILVIPFLIPSIASADPIASGLGFFKDRLVDILTGPVAGLLNSVMSYNSFFSAGVDIGWKATRDFANLFFALILLFIAIATVLNIGALDNYTAKRVLPSFIFAALFINFSKAIVGFLVDISQIIMITFYNTFASDLTNTIGSASKLSESANAASGINPATINLFALVLVVLLIFIFLWTAVILAIRIVTIWFLIIFSPLAFISFIIPPLRSLGNSWSQQLQSALVTGPVLMFYLYIAFIIMTTDIASSGASSDNLFQNGSLIQFVLVIGLLVLANIEAQKAGNSAPGVVKSAVGVAGTVATFGLGAWVGAGGYGPRQMLKKGVELADQTAGGATSIVGKNAAYESMKKDLKTQQATGTGVFGDKVPIIGRFNPLRATQGFSSEGKKQQLESFEKEKAKKLEESGEIYKAENARYLKMVSSIEAEAAKEAKEKSNIPELGKELREALDKGDRITARALASRVSEIKGGWEQLFGTGGAFAEYGLANPGNQAAQLNSFIKKNFETGKNGSSMADTPIANNFRARQAQLLRDKGSANFAVGLVERDPTLTPYSKAVEKGIIGAGAEFAKNDKMFSGSGSFDFDAFYPIIENETSLDLLADPKSWTPFNNNRNAMITNLKTRLNTETDPTKKRKIQAALKGLGSSASSRVTSS